MAQIAALDAGPMRDAAIGFVIANLAADDAVGAFELGRMVGDESARLECLSQALRKLKDPESRQDMLGQLPESDPVRKRLLQPRHNHLQLNGFE